MNGGRIPVFFKNPFPVSVEIQLIHAEHYGHVFRLPLFPIGIFIFHADRLHHVAAAGILYVVRGGYVRNPVRFQSFRKPPARFARNALMPELLSQRIAEIMTFVRIRFYVPDRNIIRLQTDRIPIALRLFVNAGKTLVVKILRLPQVFYGKPRQKPVDFFVLQQ